MDRGFEMQIFYSFLISEEEAFGRGEKKKKKTARKESLQTIYKQKQWTEDKQSSDMINDHIVIT